MTDHNPLTGYATRKLWRLRRFAEMVEETLVAQVATLDRQLADEAQKFDEEEQHDVYEYHAEDYFELSDELPTVLRYSVLTAADTALEVYLNFTCEAFADTHKARVRLSDFSGSGLQRARRYLKKVANAPFPDASPLWASVLHFHDLRNCIIHADGFVPVSRKDLREWSYSIPGLGVTEGGVISLRREFTQNAVRCYEELIKEVDLSCADLDLWLSEFPPEGGDQ